MRCLSILTFLFSIALINPAHAGVLIGLDLSVTNQLTLTATTETAIGTVTGPTSNGIVLEATGSVASQLLGGASDTFGFKSTGAFVQVETSGLLDSGVYSLNLYESSFSDSVSTSITSGQQAFVGTTTITLDATSYNNLLNGPSSGKIYAFEDNATTFATNGTYIGDWAKASTVPEPSSAIAMGLLGIVGFAGSRRRRRQGSVA
ncbi:PEP-CTERM motif protein [Stieleria bergensis]|uniref:PEP-CTERM motif protein n=1 Tax=Stieleria bergensis TaxID=2528025 RepID=A0A517SWM9_9BACT|nr:PEP-CTERM motif protein [Planctomycetes bacterium SV_7m_r]